MNWTVTPREAKVLTALVETGCHKLASTRLGVSVRTVENQIANAAKSFGPHRAPRLLMLLAWDRILRSGRPAPVRAKQRRASTLSYLSQVALRLAGRPEGVDSAQFSRNSDLTPTDAGKRLRELERVGRLVRSVEGERTVFRITEPLT